MSELSQFIIVVALGGLCFGCGYLVAFIVTRTKFRNEMIKRDLARYNQQTGKWEWGEQPKKPKAWEVQWKCNDPKRGGSPPISPSRRSWFVKRAFSVDSAFES